MVVETTLNMVHELGGINKHTAYLIGALKNLEKRYKETENEQVSKIRFLIGVRNYYVDPQYIDFLIKFYRSDRDGEDYLYIRLISNDSTNQEVFNDLDFRVGHYFGNERVGMSLIDHHVLRDMVDIFESWIKSEKLRKEKENRYGKED